VVRLQVWASVVVAGGAGDPLWQEPDADPRDECPGGPSADWAEGRVCHRRVRLG